MTRKLAAACLMIAMSCITAKATGNAWCYYHGPNDDNNGYYQGDISRPTFCKYPIKIADTLDQVCKNAEGDSTHLCCDDGWGTPFCNTVYVYGDDNKITGARTQSIAVDKRARSASSKRAVPF